MTDDLYTPLRNIDGFKTMLPDVTFGGTEWGWAALVTEEYREGGNLAIQLFIIDDLQPEPLAVVTVNFPDTPPAEGCVWVKNYSENSGILEYLVGQGILEPTGRERQSGFITCPEARVLDQRLYFWSNRKYFASAEDSRREYNAWLTEGYAKALAENKLDLAKDFDAEQAKLTRFVMALAAGK